MKQEEHRGQHLKYPPEHIYIARLPKEYIIWDYIIKKEALFTDKIIRKPELSGQSGVSGIIKHLKDFMT